MLHQYNVHSIYINNIRIIQYSNSNAFYCIVLLHSVFHLIRFQCSASQRVVINHVDWTINNVACSARLCSKCSYSRVTRYNARGVGKDFKSINKIYQMREIHTHNSLKRISNNSWLLRKLNISFLNLYCHSNRPSRLLISQLNVLFVYLNWQCP